MIAEKALSIKLKPGESIQLKPSDIDSSLSIYDNDFWRFKREIEYFEIHVDVGGAGSSFKSYPDYKVEGGPLEIVTTVAGGESTITATVSATSTYVTTLTTTTTTTHTRTTCTQLNYVTGYTTARTTSTTWITVTETTSTGYYSCSFRRFYRIIYVTVTETDVKVIGAGTVTSATCGTCPAGIYSVPSHGQTQPYSLYIIAPLIALALSPSRLRMPRKTTTMAALLLLASIPTSILASSYSPHQPWLAETITVTVTTAPTATTTVTQTVTATTTSTITETSTVTSTVLSTETRCRGVQTTITETTTWVTTTATTKYTTCTSHGQRIDITMTIVLTEAVERDITVPTYRLVCRTTVG